MVDDMSATMKQWLLRLLMRRMTISRHSATPQNIRNIALWQFGGVGDMLLTTAVIRALEKAYPEANIHFWCSNPLFAGFLRRFPQVKNIHAFPVYDFDSRTLMRSGVRAQLRQLGDTMAAQHPDMLINLHVPRLLDWWAVEWWLIKRLNLPYALGFDPRFLQHKSIFDISLNAAICDDIHYTQLYRMLLEKVGIACSERPEFPLFDADKKKAVHLLANGSRPKNRWVCMHIGGNRLQLEDKMWPVERFASLAKLLVEDGFIPVLIGMKSECDMGDALCATVAGCVNLIGHTQIEELAALIEQTDGFIGHDSGPFHMAVAVGTPCVAICGRPDAEPEYLNYNRNGIAVIIRDAPDLIAVKTVYNIAMDVFKQNQKTIGISSGAKE